MKVKATILCENSVGLPFAVVGEHGFACFVETENGSYLFDTGQGFGIVRNAIALGKDLAKIDEDGYFYHCGRADDVIISAGWTMSAVEIENTLLKHDDVQEVAVIGVPDETRGQVVKAFVVSGRTQSDDFAEGLKNFTRERLSQHEFPRHIEFVSELPKTPAGKVHRKVLRDREAAKAAPESA